MSGNLSKLEQWGCSLTKFEAARFFEIHRSFNGFVNIEKFHQFLNEYVASDDSQIETLSKKYASVATDLETGREIWLTKGSVLEAVWASISLPGLFPAISNAGKWLVDGGLVNPVPVTLCRALGADIVIAVNLNGDLVGKHLHKQKQIIKNDTGIVNKVTDLFTEHTAAILPKANHDNQPPNLFDAIASSINITQDRITRSRIAGDPPEILLSPRLTDIGLLEFYRANEAIQEGRASIQRALPEIQRLLKAV